MELIEEKPVFKVATEMQSAMEVPNGVWTRETAAKAANKMKSTVVKA